jgi:hypothetical protein
MATITGVQSRRYCKWCNAVQKGKEEARTRLSDMGEVGFRGYQFLGPSGGRIYTSQGDPGKPFRDTDLRAFIVREFFRYPKKCHTRNLRR